MNVNDILSPDLASGFGNGRPLDDEHAFDAHLRDTGVRRRVEYADPTSPVPADYGFGRNGHDASTNYVKMIDVTRGGCQGDPFNEAARQEGAE